MKKQLPTTAITNELVGASAFFQKPDTRKSAPIPPLSENQPSKNQPDQPLARPIKKPGKLDTVVSRHHATIPSPTQDTLPSIMLEIVRKAVKQFGKEAATHRFTVEEKRQLDDLVYTYGRQGYRTSENEITRIAVNWLLWDYEEQGAQSVLARILDALHQ